MRKIIATILLTLCSPAYAIDLVKSAEPRSGNHFGVGVTVSEATGLSVYAETNRDNFVQLGFGFAPYGSYAVTGDYALGYRNAFSDLPSLTPYWGVGAVLLHDQRDHWSRFSRDERASTNYVGARLPLGVNFVIPKTPVQVAAELAPTLLVTPVTYGYVQGGLSARVLF